MITVENKQYRNLQEQVLKNKEDIDYIINIKGALNEFGIRVINELIPYEGSARPESPQNGDVIAVKVGTAITIYTYSFGSWESDIDTYKEYHEEWEYGDALAISSSATASVAPYTLLILTRENITHSTDYWFNIGRFPVEGPQGPQGQTGPQGEEGNGIASITKISTVGLIDTYRITYDDGGTYDYTVTNGRNGTNGLNGVGISSLVITNGELIVTYSNGTVENLGQVKGAKGDTGDIGGNFSIRGMLDNVSQLPTPASLGDLHIAYLVGTNKNLYIQIGATSATATWYDAGILNAGTYCTAGGQFQNTFDLDTKVTSTNLVRRLYGTASDGGVSLLEYGGAVQPGKIPQYVNGGTSEAPIACLYVTTPGTATTGDSNKYFATSVDFTNRNYVPKTNTASRVYTTGSDGSQTTRGVSYNPSAYDIPAWNANGQLTTNAPTADTQCANKSYVDEVSVHKTNATGNKVYIHTQGNDTVCDYGVGAVYGRMAMWDKNSSNEAVMNTSRPTSDLHSVNKRYFDDNNKIYNHYITISVPDNGYTVAQLLFQSHSSTSINTWEKLIQAYGSPTSTTPFTIPCSGYSNNELLPHSLFFHIEVGEEENYISAYIEYTSGDYVEIYDGKPSMQIVDVVKLSAL